MSIQIIIVNETMHMYILAIQRQYSCKWSTHRNNYYNMAMQLVFITELKIFKTQWYYFACLLGS